jgi:hypothetical protein
MVTKVDGDKVVFIHSSTSKGVRFDMLNEGYWQDKLRESRRVPLTVNSSRLKFEAGNTSFHFRFRSLTQLLRKATQEGGFYINFARAALS